MAASEAAYEQARLNAQYATIRAPIGGQTGSLLSARGKPGAAQRAAARHDQSDQAHAGALRGAGRQPGGDPAGAGPGPPCRCRWCRPAPTWCSERRPAASSATPRRAPAPSRATCPAPPRARTGRPQTANRRRGRSPSWTTRWTRPPERFCSRAPSPNSGGTLSPGRFVNVRLPALGGHGDDGAGRGGRLGAAGELCVRGGAGRHRAGGHRPGDANAG